MRGLPSLVVLLAFFVWRNGRFAKNVVTVSKPLPNAYYAGGDFDSQCEIISDDQNEMKFCEDGMFWNINGLNKLVMLSCDPGRKSWNTVMGPLVDPNPHGALWLYDPSSTSPPKRIELEGYPVGHDFHPLGIEITPSRDGASSTIFAINHAREKTVIEQFTINPTTTSTATWVRTLSSPYLSFLSANSLALTGPTSFYVTNDHLFTRRLPIVGHVLPLIESVLALPGGFAVHVSLDDATGEFTTSSVAYGIPFANGISLSPDGKTVAIASCSSGYIYFYDRDSQTNSLSFNHSVETPFAADNIAYDEEGTLMVTGHPNFPQVLQVAKDLSGVLIAPSWAMSIKKLDTRTIVPDIAPVSIQDKIPLSEEYSMQTWFQSDGTKFRTSSTAFHDPVSGKFFATGLYQDGLLICKPKA